MREKEKFTNKPNEAKKDLTTSKELPDDPKIGPVKIFPWETAYIKKADPKNHDDVKAIRDIDAQPEVGKWMTGSDLTTKDFPEENFYGVCEEKDEGRINGFVWLYKPEKNLIKRLIKEKLIDFSSSEELLETSFARMVDKNSVEENKTRGLIPSALRQINFALMEKSKKLMITAFTNPKNLLSEGVLKNSGFVLKGQILYDKQSKEKDNFWALDKNELEKILKKKKSGI